jgi:hypothetical protein
MVCTSDIRQGVFDTCLRRKYLDRDRLLVITVLGNTYLLYTPSSAASGFLSVTSRPQSTQLGHVWTLLQDYASLLLAANVDHHVQGSVAVADGLFRLVCCL